MPRPTSELTAWGPTPLLGGGSCALDHPRPNPTSSGGNVARRRSHRQLGPRDHPSGGRSRRRAGRPGGRSQQQRHFQCGWSTARHPTVRPGLDSGAWTGGRSTTSALASFGDWRGRPADVVTTYSSRSSYNSSAEGTWSIRTWNGFPGRLSYALAPLPSNGEGSLASIGAGQQDAIWRQVARNLRQAGRGDSIVRVGWESDLRDWRWQATSGNADQYRSAFRRIVTTMRAEAPLRLRAEPRLERPIRPAVVSWTRCGCPPPSPGEQ